MRNQLALVTCLLFLTACSTVSVLDMPSVISQQKQVDIRSAKTFSDSQCADIGGMFMEPPITYKEGDMLNSVSDVETGSYYGHIPFHIADKEGVKEGKFDLLKTVFLIRQPDTDNFYFSFLTEKFGVVEYHFRADEGDFKCNNGLIEFPVIVNYGMIEAMLVNYQVRNVIFRDDSDALIIQETLGPYRDDSASAAKEFKSKFLQYPQYMRTEE